MNPAIVSCTVTGPGLKARPPMATYHQRTAVQRAQAVQIDQRWQREYDEAMALLSPPHVPQPPAPEMPAKLALHQEEADPQFAPDYLRLLVGAAAALLFDVGRP